jgi:hypothetical protein
VIARMDVHTIQPSSRALLTDARRYPISRWTIRLFGPRNKNDAEKLAAIRKALEKAGPEFNDGKR